MFAPVHSIYSSVAPAHHHSKSIPHIFQTCDVKLTDILIAELRCIVEPAIKEHSSKGTTLSPHCVLSSEDSPKMAKERFALPSRCATVPRFRQSPPPPIVVPGEHANARTDEHANARTDEPTIPSIPRHSIQTESHRFFPPSPTSITDRRVFR
jgi:hypothetical protein